MIKLLPLPITRFFVCLSSLLMSHFVIIESHAMSDFDQQLEALRETYVKVQDSTCLARFDAYLDELSVFTVRNFMIMVSDDAEDAGPSYHEANLAEACHRIGDPQGVFDYNAQCKPEFMSPGGSCFDQEGNLAVFNYFGRFKCLKNYYERLMELLNYYRYVSAMISIEECSGSENMQEQLKDYQLDVEDLMSEYATINPQEVNAYNIIDMQKKVSRFHAILVNLVETLRALVLEDLNR